MDQPDAFADLASSRGFLLARHALVHSGIVILLLSLFAAADSWHALTGWTLAALLACATGAVAGFVVTTVLHEWFHWLGGVVSGGAHSIPAKTGLFVFDWQFEQNSVRQFYVMSIGGSVGGILAVIFLARAIELDAPGRVALLAGAVASFTFAAIIEWPILIRTRASGNPFQELSAITPGVLGRAAAGALLAGIICGWLF